MLDWLGMTFGECFVVVVLTAFIVSASYWPKAGAWVAEQLLLRRKEMGSKVADK